jgi:hypothetical protein
MKAKFISLLVVGFASIATTSADPQIHVEVHLPAIAATSGNPVGYDVPLTALQFNDRPAIDSGGSQNIRANDIESLWYLVQRDKSGPGVDLGLKFLFSGNREAYPIVKSNEPHLAVLPVVGSNLANKFPAVVSSSTFRNDITASGLINSSDVVLAKARSGTGIP